MSVEVDMTEEDRLYNEGYDDGVADHVKTSTHPAYLEGYYDGVEDREETNDWDYDYYYCSGCSDCTWDDGE